MVKEIIKIVRNAIIIVILLWVILLVINIILCLNYKRPILARYGIIDEYRGTYEYIGYTIVTSWNMGGPVESSTVTFFNKFVFETVKRDTKAYDKNLGTGILIEPNSVTKKGATIVIVDDSKPACVWDNMYTIEKRVDNNWEKIEPIKDMTYEKDYIVDKSNKMVLQIDWTPYYGELSNGTYVIAKKAYNKKGRNKKEFVDIFSSSFTIEE